MPYETSTKLLHYRKLHSAILLTAIFGVVGRDRLCFTETCTCNSARFYSSLHDILHHRFCAVFGECQVLIVRANIIGMAADRNCDLLVLLHQFYNTIEFRKGLWSKH